MERRAGPGNDGRAGGSGRSEPQATGDLEALDQYGYGEKDPATGVWSNYDIPAGHPANQTDEGPGGKVIAWDAIVAQWPLIVADFASEYGIRLPAASMLWPEFDWLVSGLFAADTRLYRHFFPPKQEPFDQAEREG